MVGVEAAGVADLVGRQGAAVEAAEQEVGQGPGGRRLVEDPGVLPLDVVAQPGGRGVEPAAVERERRGVPGRQLGRVQVPALVVAALQGPADEAQVVAPRGAAPASRAPTGRTLVDPSERRTPVPAAAACMTALAWSAAGCSRLWWAAAMPQEAE